MRAILLSIACLMTGCAALPDAASLEAHHVSHLAQHFQNPQADHGEDIAALTLRWQRGRWHLEASEGWAFHGRDGCLECVDRDTAEVRVGYDVWVRR